MPVAKKKKITRKPVPLQVTGKARLAGPFKITGDVPPKLKGKNYYINETRKAHQDVQIGKVNALVKGWLIKTHAGRWRAHPNGVRKAMNFMTRRQAALYIVGAWKPVDKKAPTKKAPKKPRGKHNPPDKPAKVIPPVPPPPELTKKEVAKITTAFKDLRAEAAEKYPKVAQTGLKLDPSIHKKPRDFGMASLEKPGPMVYVAPELAKQSASCIKGILGHELGHIIVLIGYFPIKKGYDAMERQADAVAEDAFGQKMFYTKNGVQSMGRGAKGARPRPKGLR